MRGQSYEGAKPADSGDDAYAGRRVALVIGNSAYQQERDVLQNPVNDTKAIAAALSRIGFCGIARSGEDFTVDFARPGVEPLFDLDQKHLGRALAAVHRVAPGVQQAVIYYAGHGIEVHGENYLIPVDARLAHIADAEYETQPLSRALRAIEGATGLRLVILDACRNNPFRARLFGQRDAGGGLRSVEPPSTVLVAYSAKHGTTAWDGNAGANSPFASALLAHMEKPGLEVVDLFREVKDDVLEATDHAQEPYLYGSPGRQKEYFVPPKDGLPPPPPPEPTEREQTSGHNNGGRNHNESPDRRWRWIGVGTGAAGVVAVTLLFWDPISDWFSPEPLPTNNGDSSPREARGRESNDPFAPVEIELANGETKRIVPGSGESFKECDVCPEMVVAPAGTFVMGSGDGETPVVKLDGSEGEVLPYEEGRSDDEGPPHEVRIPEPFAIGKFEVTFAEWDACVADGGCTHSPEEGPGRGKHPVMRVSYEDITQQYIPWLNKKVSGDPDKPYRLPSEAEWEYAARAGTETRYWIGDEIPEGAAQYGYFNPFWTKTVHVDSFDPNPWGLYNVNGNVWERVEDCWNGSYANKPDSLKASGAAWTTGDCDYRVLRGGSWFSNPQILRSALRYWFDRDFGGNFVGFRLARTLTP